MPILTSHNPLVLLTRFTIRMSMRYLVNVFEVFLPQLLLCPNPSDPLNGEAAALMMRDRTTYDQRVKGTLYTMAEIVEFVNEAGEFEGEYTAYMVDAGSTIIVSTLGVSPVATFVELSAGIREGGRTKIRVLFPVVFVLHTFDC